MPALTGLCGARKDRALLHSRPPAGTLGTADKIKRLRTIPAPLLEAPPDANEKTGEHAKRGNRERSGEQRVLPSKRPQRVAACLFEMTYANNEARELRFQPKSERILKSALLGAAECSSAADCQLALVSSEENINLCIVHTGARDDARRCAPRWLVQSESRKLGAPRNCGARPFPTQNSQTKPPHKPR